MKLHKTLTVPRSRFLTPCTSTDFNFRTVNHYVLKYVSKLVPYTSIPQYTYFVQSNTTLKNVYYRPVQVKSFPNMTAAEHGKNLAKILLCRDCYTDSHLTVTYQP